MTQRIRRKSSGTGCDDVYCLDYRFQHSGESVTTVNSYEQISELLTECVLKGEVNMDLQEQLVQCLRILMFERRSRAANGDDHERKAHWSRVCVNITLCFQPVQTCTLQSCTVHWWSTVGHVKDVSVAQAHLLPGSRSLTCKSRENEGCLNVVGHCVVVVTHILFSCMFLPFPFPTRTTLETRCNVRQSIWRSVKFSVALVVSW